MSPYLFDAFNHILVLEDDFLAHIQKQKPITIIPFLLLLATTSSLADGFIIPPPEFPPLSVKYHHVDVTVDNQVATTRVDQVFVNKSPFQMEGDYIFPLPDDVSISELLGLYQRYNGARFCWTPEVDRRWRRMPAA